MNIHKKNIVNDSRIKILHKKTTVKQRHQENIDNEGVKKSIVLLYTRKKKIKKKKKKKVNSIQNKRKKQEKHVPLIND